MKSGFTEGPSVWRNREDGCQESVGLGIPKQRGSRRVARPALLEVQVRGREEEHGARAVVVRGPEVLQLREERLGARDVGVQPQPRTM